MNQSLKKIAICLMVVLFVFTSLQAQKKNKNTRDYASNVTIARDKWGVPHIYGKTDADVAYGLAWANCEDDFETLQEMLLLIKGMKGRVDGKSGAVTDFFVHALGAKKVVDEKYETDLSPHFRAYLDAYAAGVNDWVKKHPKEVKVKKAFPITGREIIEGYYIQNILISGASSQIESAVKGRYDLPKNMGSNAFAFSAPFTDNGNTMLCANPHVAFEGLFSWYEIHLKSDEGLNMLGALLPGGVTAFVGTNENLGWSHTWNGLDLVDVYRLKMNPKKKNEYWFDGAWHKLEKRPVWLKVKLKGLPRIPVKKMTYWSVYGPTLKSDGGQYYSVRFGPLLDIRSAEQWFLMDKAKNFDEFHEAIKMGSLSRFNIIYADKDGHIMYLDQGMIPDRSGHENYDWGGVVPGDTSATLWTKLIPIDSLPKVFDPACGYVFNANNTPYDASCESADVPWDSYSDVICFRKGNNNRSERFMELMNQYPSVNFDIMKAIKFDDQYPQHSDFLASVVNLMSLDLSAHPELATMRDKMLKWDRKVTPESTEATMFLLVFDYIFHKKGYDDHAFFGAIDVEDSLIVNALQFTHDHLMKYFGSVDVPIDKVQVIQRKKGGPIVYMPGFADALAANYAKKNDKDGRFYGFVGDTYTLLVEYDSTGIVRLETQSPFGASARPDSPHFTDQLVKLFTKQKTKTMTLDWDTIVNNAERVYHPK